jgi:trigger factor
VNPIAQPEYEYELPASESEDWRFSATVEVQPKPEPADWTQLEVPKHEAEVPAEAVQAELEALQTTVGELVAVEGRPAEDGDTAIVDLISEDGSAQRDYVVDLGSERLVEEIENGIRGLATGESREIAYELADGARRSASVTLKDLKQRVLPPLDDELAKAASEFDTLDELRSEIEDRLRGEVEEELDGLFRAAAVDELVKATKFTAAGPLVEARTRELLNGLARSLQSRGIDANAYLQLTGQSPEVLEARLRGEAAMSVAREVVLEAVADKLGIQVSDDDIRAELREAGETDEDIEQFVAAGGADRVRDDIRLKKALDRVAAEVQPIAPELHEAREAIWTPEQEQAATEQKIWTPGS